MENEETSGPLTASDVVTPTKTDPELNSIQVTLVGMKNLKTAHVWRLEFDVFEIDNSKVKELMDKIDTSFHLVLVQIPSENEPLDNKE